MNLIVRDPESVCGVSLVNAQPYWERKGGETVDVILPADNQGSEKSPVPSAWVSRLGKQWCGYRPSDIEKLNLLFESTKRIER
jgi:hypothetical protein